MVSLVMYNWRIRFDVNEGEYIVLMDFKANEVMLHKEKGITSLLIDDKEFSFEGLTVERIIKLDA